MIARLERERENLRRTLGRKPQNDNDNIENAKAQLRETLVSRQY